MNYKIREKDNEIYFSNIAQIKKKKNLLKKIRKKVLLGY